MSQQQESAIREPAALSRWLAASYAIARSALAGRQVAALKVAAQSASFRRGLRYFYFVALVLLLGTLGLLAAGTAPTLFGYNNYVINGGSMEPSLQVGSIAITRGTSPFALEVGDIIARNDPPDGSPVLHRVVEITNVDGQRAFVTQGDQNRTPDTIPIVLAGTGDRVVYSVPYAGYILNFARSWLGRVILLGVPVALLAITSAVQAGGWLKRRSKASAGTATEPTPLRQAAPAEATASETSEESQEEPVAIKAARQVTSPETDDKPSAIEAAQPDAPAESEDEPVAIEAVLQETLPETKDEPAPETLPGVPDNPFPIEAALAAKANEKQDHELPQDADPSETPGQGGERPALRNVPLPETPDDVPVFLLDQLRRRRGASPTSRPQEPDERRVA